MPITASETRAGFDASAFEAFLHTRQEPSWWRTRRREAFALFEELRQKPLDPEEWKRIELRPFQPEQFRVMPAAGQAEQLPTLMQSRAAFAGTVTHLDGQCRRVSLQKSLAEQGVLFGDLAELVGKHGDLLQRYWSKAVRCDCDRFAAWHTAFCTGGTVLYVPEGVAIEEPLHSLIALSQDGTADFSHTLVILERGASATLLEETASVDPERTGLHVGAVELLVGEQATLRYVQLQNWNQRTWHFAQQAGRVATEGRLQWTVGGLGAKLAHIHQDVDLDGPGAEAQVNGVSFATDRQTLSFYTQQTHRAHRTRSDLLYKDVLRDRSRVVWRGMIKVFPEAQQTDGYQRNDALLLSDSCRVDAIPGLEIEADDVRCTHGTTAGRVDEEQILYCMCRGLTEREAMHMIVGGFLQTVSDRIPVEMVRETLNQAVQRKLGLEG
ncbi:MAG TPA: Fe-S cluster assembly protein SufD [Planctomycetaceae bacterium]|nr:Fe-S cluster assembly protein SufD [Planctomycetaceae bacterium]